MVTAAANSKSETARGVFKDDDFLRTRWRQGCLASEEHSHSAVALASELIRAIPGVMTDRRRVVPGTLFFALPGKHTDGISFIDEVVSLGAVAIVVAKMPVSTPAESASGVTRRTHVKESRERVSSSRSCNRHEFVRN